MTDSYSRVKTQFSLGLFADDAAFWRVGISFLDDTKNDLQKDIFKLQKWAENWGVTISQAKTVSIIFVKLLRTTRKNLTYFLTIN